MRTLADAPLLVLDRPGFLHDTDPLADVRAESWLVRTTYGGLVIDREHVQALLADRRLRSAAIAFIEMQGVTDGIVHHHLGRSLLALEGDDHQRIRSLVSRAFTPRAIERHRPAARAAVEELAAALVAPPVEFMAAVADPLPIRVISEVLGVPAGDHATFASWARAISYALTLDLAAHREEADAGMAALDAYVGDLIAERRAHPGDDLVSELVRAEEAGDRLTDGELRTLVVSLLFAGFDTTRNQLGLLVWAFSQHPDQWALLAERPDLAPAAVEEGMRFAGSAGSAPRLVAETFELDGYVLEAGTVLMLSTGAANRDPAAVAEPLRLDITAPRPPQLTFGGGIHFCLGAALARTELQEALAVLPAAMPGLALDGEPTWPTSLVGIYGPDALPVRWSSLEDPGAVQPNGAGGPSAGAR